MRRLARLAIALAAIVLVPHLAFGQASITGVVKDTSGAVMPGVTVEAASPALIEKVRSVVTDGAGQYRIVDLRPGVYTVTFTLPGFSSVRREGVELAGSFTATINADLRVGTIEEAITVTGETPVVDVQNAQQQQIVSRDMIAAIPTDRSYQGIVTLNPAIIVTGTDRGGTRGPESDRYTAHGSTITDSRIMVDGLGIASADGGGASGSYYIPNVTASQEVVATTSGGLGEAETSGVMVNVIPRDGGNVTSGTLFFSGSNSSLQGSNYTQAVENQGLRAPNRVDKMWDLSPAVGGPISRDKLWYFGYGKHAGGSNFIAGIFHNKNAGDPNAWTYDPDLSRQAIQYMNWWGTALRLTWQASPRNKFAIMWDEQYRCVGCPGATATGSPESVGRTYGWPTRVSQATWTSPYTNRLLLEAGFGTHILNYGGGFEGPDVYQRLITVTEQAGAIPGLGYRALSSRNRNGNSTYNWRSSVSYVTGAHNAKIGYRGSFYYNRRWTYYPNGGLAYRFNNGVPNQLSERVENTVLSHQQAHGVYAQDQWTVQRLTLQGAVRYDHYSSSYPETGFGGNNPFIPTVFTFPERSGASFHDLTPRVSAAYDVLGDGKTALQARLGKYMVGQESSDSGIFGTLMNPIRRSAVSTNRSWADANRNFVPDCDLRNRAANGECGAMDNRNFGTDTFSVNYDPDVIHGWGVRPYSWEGGVSVQREIVARVSATVGYSRRWFGNFMVTDNLALAATDYTLFNLPVPVDSRLPDSGGVVTGVATINPDKFGQTNNQVTAASNYGRWTERWHGVDVSLNARLPFGLVMQGGMSTGSFLKDNCEVAAKLPEMLSSTGRNNQDTTSFPNMEFCRQEQPFQTQVKGFGSYTIPRIDLQLSGAWQSTPGPEVQALYNAPNAVIAPVIGRPLAGNAANQTVNIVSPLSVYADRVNQVDLRVAKLLTFRRTKTLIGVDIFNALNTSAVLTQNNTYGTTWLVPRSIATPRLARISAQFDF